MGIHIYNFNKQYAITPEILIFRLISNNRNSLDLIMFAIASDRFIMTRGGMLSRSFGSTVEVVFLRHAQSTWNKENIFSGWNDSPLTKHGVLEARLAGKYLKASGIMFDEVLQSFTISYNCLLYTSPSPRD